MPILDEVRAQFEQWRQTRQGKARFPDELWTVAVGSRSGKVATGISAALHLDGGKLRKLMLGAGAADVSGIIAPGGNADLAFALLLSQGLKTFLFEIAAIHPETLIGMSVVFATVAMFACCVPTRQPAKMEPLEALRHE